MIGSGERLVPGKTTPTAWKHSSVRASGTGVLIHLYERTGCIAYGRLPGT